MSKAANHDPIEDTDNLNQKMQIRSLNEARKRVRSVRNSAQEQIASAPSKQQPRARKGGQTVYLEVVKSYALELVPNITQHAPELWDHQPLINVEVQFENTDPEKEIVEVQPEIIRDTITGLRDFLLTDFPLRGTFEVTYRDTAKGNETVRKHQTWTPSFAQTDAVLMQIDEARNDLGLHFEGPNEVDTTHKDYGNDTSW